jgi:hypothetical protein
MARTLQSNSNSTSLAKPRPKGFGVTSIPRPRPICGEEDFSGYSIEELYTRWRKEFRKSVPPLQKVLLAQLLAYKLRARTEGELDAETIRYLHKIALDDRKRREAGENKPKEVPPISLPRRKSSLKPGTMIVREHNGVVHKVTVLKDGYEWQGQEFKSLSAIASTITGTRWNGPRFFGLREDKTNSSDRETSR